MASKTKRGQHPNSLANLENRGNTPKYGEKKTYLQMSLTPTAKEQWYELARSFGCRTPSDLAEKIGRGKFELVAIEETV